MRQRLLPILAALTLLASQALATWSLVVVNLRTGEVCIASATCIENYDLLKAIGVITSEVGVGATQSFAVSAATRQRIHTLMLEGASPQEILDIIAVDDPMWLRRQIGLVDMAGRAVSYSGINCGTWFGGVTGQQGDFVYAIQGNVLTGAPVVADCEAAFLATPGDMGQKVMAAMEAAMAMGGDGRCSCSPAQPESCGSPPVPGGKSAHIACFVIARPGDNEICGSQNCTGGDFYLRLNYINYDRNDPDPVLLMRPDFDAWRAALDGRPDGSRSTVWPPAAAATAGAGDVVSYVLDLSDVNGNAVQNGGATITLEHDARSAGLSSLLNVTDHLDGTYTVEVQSGAGPGLDFLRFVVDDGIRAVTLWPPARLLHAAPPSTPTAAGAAVAGLTGFQDLIAAHLAPDGLSAWLIADQGAGRELLQFTRPSAGAPFGAPAAFTIGAFPTQRLTDVWVSADGLRTTFTAYDRPQGVSHVYSSQRPDLVSDFDEPMLLQALDSGLGEQGLDVSDDELEIVFASKRDGNWDLMRARRLKSNARFFPPEKIAALATADDELSPAWEAGDTRLIFSRAPAGGDSWLYTSTRDQDDAFGAAQLLAGIAPADSGQIQAVDPSDNSIWVIEPGAGGRALAAFGRPSGSLVASQSALSASAGGAVDFALDAGAALGQAHYKMMAGLPGSSIFDPDTALPFARSGPLDALLADPAHAHLFQGLSGRLDAQGRAAARWTLPPGFLTGPGMIGRSIQVAFGAFAGSLRFVSEAQGITIEP